MDDSIISKKKIENLKQLRDFFPLIKLLSSTNNIKSNLEKSLNLFLNHTTIAPGYEYCSWTSKNEKCWNFNEFEDLNTRIVF